MEPSKSQSTMGPQNSPNKGKGKEPASFASRIASSASGLAKDALTSRGSHDAVNSFASTSGMGSKVANTSSSTSQEPWSHNLPARPGTSITDGSSNGSNDNFRSAFHQHVPDGEFEDFIETQPTLPYERICENEHQSVWPGEFQQHSPVRHGEYNELQSSHINLSDGAEMATLLNDAHIFTDLNSMDVVMAEPDESAASDLFQTNYSQEEARAAKRIQSSLPSPPVHAQISPENPLNLKPALAGLLPHMDLSTSDQHVGSEEDLDLYFANTPEREQWVSEWDGVLNGYTDEVWGNMLNSVRVARSQLEEVKAGSKHVDNHAVNRLRMILGHIQSTNSDLAYQQSSFQDTAQYLGLSQDNAMSQQYQGTIVIGTAQKTIPNSMASKYSSAQRMEPSVQQGSQSRKDFEDQYRRQEQHRRRDSPMADNDEYNMPTFHCPWISCHQRFNNARELRLHTSAHTQYACPHEGCTAQFQGHEGWAEHIEGPHHDLLESSFRSMRSSED